MRKMGGTKRQWPPLLARISHELPISFESHPQQNLVGLFYSEKHSQAFHKSVKPKLEIHRIQTPEFAQVTCSYFVRFEKMSRWNDSNCLWKLCGCGGLLPILLLKMAFCSAIAAIGAVVSCSLLGLFYLLKGVPLTIYRLLHYAKLGLKIRCFLCLLSLVPAALFLPLFVAFCTLTAALYGVVAAWEATMDSHKCFLWGLNDFPSELYEGFSTTREGLDRFLDDREWSSSGPPPGELAWDITWCMLLECLLALVFACVIFLPLFALLIVFKLPFVLAKTYYTAWVEFLDQDLAGLTGWGCMSILFLVAHVFIPIPVVLVALATLVHGLILALFAVYVAYDYSLCAAIKYLFAALQRWDAQTYWRIRQPWTDAAGPSDPAGETERCGRCCPNRQCSPLDACCSFEADIQDYAKEVIDLA
eukprot:g78344.t1